MSLDWVAWVLSFAAVALVVAALWAAVATVIFWRDGRAYVERRRPPAELEGAAPDWALWAASLWVLRRRPSGWDR